MTKILSLYVDSSTTAALVSAFTDSEIKLIEDVLLSQPDTDIICSYAYGLFHPDELLCIITDMASRI